MTFGNSKRQRTGPLAGTSFRHGDPPARPASPRQPDRPASASGSRRDADVWHLAALFRQYAQADGIELAKGLPIIAAEITDLVDRYDVRGKSFRHLAAGCTRRHLPAGLAERCWYHYPPLDPDGQRDGLVTWVHMVEVIMAEFWSRRWDIHALDDFRQHFAEYGRAAMQHWGHLAILRSVQAAGPTRRDIMRRATMTDAIKEG